MIYIETKLTYTNNLGVPVKVTLYYGNPDGDPTVGSFVLAPGESVTDAFPAEQIVIEAV